ncbi:MAG: response regulator transcription factor [Lachnospiraceae bacterium]|nr:response regulator transcription factor [Lachnospiraceae bacterium]
MNKFLILVIEDDYAIRNLITTTLETQNYKFRTSENGTEGIMAAASYQPDVILLDLGLPDMDGVDVIRKIRLWSNVPIIVISARSEDSDKIEALDNGADDYLTKPFSVDELLARLRVTKRRLLSMSSETGNQGAVFENGALKIDYLAGTVFVETEELHLTPIEYKLLCLLAHNVGKVLTHNYIIKEIWGNSMESDLASLRVFMATLRKKLDKRSDGIQYIQTHIGIGYRMVRV